LPTTAKVSVYFYSKFIQNGVAIELKPNIAFIEQRYSFGLILLTTVWQNDQN
jgi:hypothetical protein